MSIRPSGRIVLPRIPTLAVCTIPIRENGIETVRVSAMSCCGKQISPCIVQGAAKTFQFTDSASVDFTGSSEVTFTIWQKNIAGTQLLNKVYTGSDISFPSDNVFSLTITNSESAALPAGVQYCEAWVTISTGERRCVGLGRFTVEDSRKHD